MPYYVYLLASRKHGTLYVGMTSDLVRRVYEHKAKAVPGFTSWCGVYPVSAITREKDIKTWQRDWKIRLIEKDNPDWLDRYDMVVR